MSYVIIFFKVCSVFWGGLERGPGNPEMTMIRRKTVCVVTDEDFPRRLSLQRNADNFILIGNICKCLEIIYFMRKDSVQQLDGVPCLLAAFRHQTWKPMVDDKSRTISVMLPLISTSVIHIT